MKALFTIGYEGADIIDFVAALKRENVDVLLDIRELAISRRKGFSKNGLSEALRKAGIEYRHEPLLGSPKEIRDQLHKDGDYPAFFAAFGEYLEQHKELIRELTRSLDSNVALMCYERDPLVCHRRVVAKVMGAMTKLTTQHLGVSKEKQGSGRTNRKTSDLHPS